GEPFHVDGVRKILAGAGLEESALGCPEDFPEDRTVVERGRVFMNCSGKHAAMLATCVANDWPTTGYPEVTQPLPRAIRATVEELTGERVAASGSDGCGAPLFFVSMLGVAKAYRSLALGEEDSRERVVFDTMRAHPEWTSGTHRPEAALMRALPGLMVKAGAEGVQAFVFEDGR